MKLSPRQVRQLAILRADIKHAYEVACAIPDDQGVTAADVKELRAITRTDGSLPCGLLFELIEQQQQANDDSEGVPLADLAAGK